MKRTLYIFCLLTAILLTGCGVKKKAAKPIVEWQEEEAPAWQTCLIQGARVTVVTDGGRVSANATMQVVRDSMLIISIMPMFGIEMMRLEATPEEIIGIDKMHAQYAVTTFEAANNKLNPALTWEDLQAFCTAEMPLGSERARLFYTYGDELIEISISYPTRMTDVPLRMGRLPLDRYTQIDISRWL